MAVYWHCATRAAHVNGFTCVIYDWGEGWVGKANRFDWMVLNGNRMLSNGECATALGAMRKATKAARTQAAEGSAP